MPMLKGIDNRLLGCSTLLSTGDKLTLIKSVFSSMPIFFMCTLWIAKTVVKQINSYFMNCFWRKFGTQERYLSLFHGTNYASLKHKVVWLSWMSNLITRPYSWNSFISSSTKRIPPWVKIIRETHYQDCLPSEKMVGSFWWKAILRTLPTFKQHAICTPGKGDTTLFWSDKWMGEPLKHKFPKFTPLS